SSATHSVAVRNRTRWPARHARTPKAIEMWVLPVPGGPSRITFCLACRKSSCPRCSITCFFTLRWKVKSNSSSVLVAGNRAARIRSRPPEDSREDSSVESSASANRSYDHSSWRARSVRFGSARAAAGAFIARNTCVSSDCCGSCDPLVIDRQRPPLDHDLLARAVALAQRPGGLKRGDRAVLGKHPLVATGELAGVQRDRG